jgi:hypothetical protein
MGHMGLSHMGLNTYSNRIDTWKCWRSSHHRGRQATRREASGRLRHRRSSILAGSHASGGGTRAAVHPGGRCCASCLLHRQHSRMRADRGASGSGARAAARPWRIRIVIHLRIRPSIGFLLHLRAVWMAAITRHDSSSAATDKKLVFGPRLVMRSP